MQQWLLAFDSTHHAIAAETRIKAAEPAAWTIQMIPTPRQITASCGLSLLITGSGFPDALLRLLEKTQVEWAGLYERQGPGSAPWIRIDDSRTTEGNSSAKEDDSC